MLFYIIMGTMMSKKNYLAAYLQIITAICLYISKLNIRDIESGWGVLDA